MPRTRTVMACVLALGSVVGPFGIQAQSAADCRETPDVRTGLARAVAHSETWSPLHPLAKGPDGRYAVIWLKTGLSLLVAARTPELTVFDTDRPVLEVGLTGEMPVAELFAPAPKSAGEDWFAAFVHRYLAAKGPVHGCIARVDSSYMALNSRLGPAEEQRLAQQTRTLLEAELKGVFESFRCTLDFVVPHRLEFKALATVTCGEYVKHGTGVISASGAVYQVYIPFDNVWAQSMEQVRRRLSGRPRITTPIRF